MLTAVTTLIDEDDGINVGAGTSLREAIAYATDAMITFAPSLSGRINLTRGQLAVNRSVTITGSTPALARSRSRMVSGHRAPHAVGGSCSNPPTRAASR